jgi:hypothetical protein
MIFLEHMIAIIEEEGLKIFKVFDSVVFSKPRSFKQTINNKALDKRGPPTQKQKMYLVNKTFFWYLICWTPFLLKLT